MTPENNTETEWNELVEKEAAYKDMQSMNHFIRGAKFTRANVTKIPEVAKLIEKLNEASENRYMLTVVDFANIVEETVRKLRGEK